MGGKRTKQKWCAIATENWVENAEPWENAEAKTI